MPLYEYQCDGKCGKRFEKIRKFSDPPLEKCPTCGGPVHKLQSSPAIQFKGSGFYITDYGKKDAGSGGKADKADRAEKSEKSEKGEKSEKSEKRDTGSSTTETKSSSDKAEKPAEKKSSDTSAGGTPKKP